MSVGGVGGGAGYGWGDIPEIEAGGAPPLEPETAVGGAKESLRPSDVLLPLAGGFLLPRGEDLIRGRSFKRLDVANLPKNWKAATADFQPLGSDPKRDVLMHGSAGAYMGYLPLRGAGFSPLESALGAAAVGVGIELGQSLEPRHKVSFGDMARTTLYGTALGEGLHQVHTWAERKHKESGNGLYKALSFATNPAAVTLDIGRNRVGASFTYTF